VEGFDSSAVAEQVVTWALILFLGAVGTGMVAGLRSVLRHQAEDRVSRLEEAADLAALTRYVLPHFAPGPVDGGPPDWSGTLPARVERIEAETKPNSGHTMRDALARIEAHVGLNP